MTNYDKIQVIKGGQHEDKPAYIAPTLTELDTGQTASGVVVGAPENSSYSS